MKFLVDAHISVEMVAMLRELGHDCLDSAAIPARMPDVEVLRMAATDGRAVITADKDFGELVFIHGIQCLCASPSRTRLTGSLLFARFGRG